MSTNRYEEIAERHRVRRVRDIAFALLLAAVAAFSITALGSAGHHSHAPSVSTTPSCQIAPSC